MEIGYCQECLDNCEHALILADIASSEPSALYGRIAGRVRKNIAWKNRLKE
jgi:hypothetical protein